jgi:hypothetical protein
MELINIYDESYDISIEKLYVYLFQRIPDTFSPRSVTPLKLLEFLRENYKDEITDEIWGTYDKQYDYDYPSIGYENEDEEDEEEDDTITNKNKSITLIFKNLGVIIKTSDYDKVENSTRVFYNHNDPRNMKLVQEVDNFNVPEPPKNKIFFILKGMGGLYLKPIDLDDANDENFELSYNDDLVSHDDMVVSRLMDDNDNGVVLLHGKPGCGKTYYIRHLAKRLDKKLIFVPQIIASEISSPGFLSFLFSNCKNSILIIEDAEKIIESREHNKFSTISDILNITDGLFTNFLKIKMLCTFNCDVDDIDSALLRKGRLIFKYEFTELKKEKAQKLSDKLGFNTKIEEDMTLTDVYNQNEIDFGKEEVHRIGF